MLCYIRAYPCYIRAYPFVAEMTRAQQFFLIVASANYPNFLSVKWFLTDVLPLIPSVNVKIVGNVDLEFICKRQNCIVSIRTVSSARLTTLLGIIPKPWPS